MPPRHALGPLCQCRGHAQYALRGRDLPRSPWDLRLSDWTVRRGRPDRLSAAGIVSESTRRAGLSRSHPHHNDLTVRPVRLAQALARMEAATETVVDADDSPHLAAVR